MSTCCCDPECWEPVPVISGLFFLRCLADVFVYRASVIEPKPIIVEGKKCPVHGFKYYLGLQSFDVLHKGKDRVVQPIHISGPGVVNCWFDEALGMPDSDLQDGALLLRFGKIPPS